MTWRRFLRYIGLLCREPPVTIPLTKGQLCGVECFFSCKSKWAVKQTVELLMTLGIMTPTWRNCNANYLCERIVLTLIIAPSLLIAHNISYSSCCSLVCVNQKIVGLSSVTLPVGCVLNIDLARCGNSYPNSLCIVTVSLTLAHVMRGDISYKTEFMFLHFFLVCKAFLTGQFYNIVTYALWISVKQKTGWLKAF